MVFKIPNNGNFNGIIQLEDQNLTFDNTHFFSISKPEKVNVISVGKNTKYLSKIYTKSEFNFSQKTLKNLNYNSIEEQHLIILNELEEIPIALTNSLNAFVKNGGNLVIVPSKKSNLNSYNLFLKELNIGKIKEQVDKELKITDIHFSHPLLNDVFEKKVMNFQYPTVNKYYNLNLNNSSSIVSFQNKEPFISEIKSNKGIVYLFSSSLETSITNFKNSPLIVPVFYNFGKLSFKHNQLFYRVSSENKIDIKTTIEKDKVLRIANKENSFIPLQQKFQNKVRIITKEQPEKTGIYTVLKNLDTIQKIAYNNPKKESLLHFMDLNELKKVNKNISISTSIPNVFQEINKKNEVHWLWKWFLTLAIVSLLLEILILKFYKP